MIAEFAYDTTSDPPAPVVLVRITEPGGRDPVMVPMLLDTGADCTIVPAAVARQLGLPQVDIVQLGGVGGRSMRAPVHAAMVEIGSFHALVRVVALSDEAILGRDVLNQLLISLDGPGLTISVRGRSVRSKRSPRR